MLAQLSKHFGERVAPVSEYCKALYAWADVMKTYDPDTYQAAMRVNSILNKSNLASRLVYGGEEVRTVPCPKHKGQWQGCVFPVSKSDSVWCECLYGCNVTGWLPNTPKVRVAT